MAFLVAYRNFIEKLKKNESFLMPLKIEVDWSIQMIRMGKSNCQMWIDLGFWDMNRFCHDLAHLTTCMSRVVRKSAFCICENKDAISFAVTAKLNSAFVFATWKV